VECFAPIVGVTPDGLGGFEAHVDVTSAACAPLLASLRKGGRLSQGRMAVRVPAEQIALAKGGVLRYGRIVTTVNGAVERIDLVDSPLGNETTKMETGASFVKSQSEIDPKDPNAFTKAYIERVLPECTPGLG
jgi:hypothetical protein